MDFTRQGRRVFHIVLLNRKKQKRARRARHHTRARICVVRKWKEYDELRKNINIISSKCCSKSFLDTFSIPIIVCSIKYFSLLCSGFIIYSIINSIPTSCDEIDSTSSPLPPPALRWHLDDYSFLLVGKILVFSSFGCLLSLSHIFFPYCVHRTHHTHKIHTNNS